MFYCGGALLHTYSPGGVFAVHHLRLRMIKSTPLAVIANNSLHPQQRFLSRIRACRGRRRGPRSEELKILTALRKIQKNRGIDLENLRSPLLRAFRVASRDGCFPSSECCIDDEEPDVYVRGS